VLRNTVLIFLGCGGGGVARYWTSRVTHYFLGDAFPYGTLFVNVSGSLVMGFLLTLFITYSSGSMALRAFFLIGFLGGYTTFSSFSIETMLLIERGATAHALTNIVLSVILCLMASWVGIILGRQL